MEGGAVVDRVVRKGLSAEVLCISVETWKK